jgi:hypothetical protein
VPPLPSQAVLCPPGQPPDKGAARAALEKGQEGPTGQPLPEPVGDPPKGQQVNGGPCCAHGWQSPAALAEAKPAKEREASSQAWLQSNAPCFPGRTFILGDPKAPADLVAGRGEPDLLYKVMLVAW